MFNFEGQKKRKKNNKTNGKVKTHNYYIKYRRAKTAV